MDVKRNHFSFETKMFIYLNSAEYRLEGMFQEKLPFPRFIDQRTLFSKQCFALRTSLEHEGRSKKFVVHHQRHLTIFLKERKSLISWHFKSFLLKNNSLEGFLEKKQLASQCHFRWHTVTLRDTVFNGILSQDSCKKILVEQSSARNLRVVRVCHIVKRFKSLDGFLVRSSAETEKNIRSNVSKVHNLQSFADSTSFRDSRIETDW